MGPPSIEADRVWRSSLLPSSLASPFAPPCPLSLYTPATMPAALQKKTIVKKRRAVFKRLHADRWARLDVRLLKIPLIPPNLILSMIYSNYLIFEASRADCRPPRSFRFPAVSIPLKIPNFLSFFRFM